MLFARCVKNTRPALLIFAVFLGTLALPATAWAQAVPTPQNDPNPAPAADPAPPAPAPDGSYDPPALAPAPTEATPPAEATAPTDAAPADATAPTAAPTTAAPTAAPTTATPPTTAELKPVPGTQTRWEPFDREAARTADGSLDVCSTMVFPLTFIPGVGDVVGTVGDWLCIVPAAIAVDYTGAFHGGRESHFWQPALALVLKQAWETVLDTPIFVVTLGVLVGGAAGAVALAATLNVPVTLVSAGVVGGTFAAYMALKAGRDGISDVIFEVVYGGLTDDVEGEALVQVQKDSLLKPAVTGVPAGFGLIATVAGSKPHFDWAFAIPVVGPVWRADEHAKNIQNRVRRYGREVLLEDKKDLSGVDDISTLLATTQGYAYATAHVTLATGLVFFGSGLAVSFTDKNNEQQALAEVLGGIGLGAVAVGGAAVVVGIAADRLQPVLVPAAYALAE